MSTRLAATDDLWFLDTRVKVRVSAHDGVDGVSVIESRAPYGDSPPLHVHRTEDEVFHVLEGELRLVIDDETVALSAGETALAPKGVPHTYVVTSAETAAWLVVTAHGDFERFVRATSRLPQHEGLPEPSGPPTPEAAQALAEAAAAHGIELVGPPVSP